MSEQTKASTTSRGSMFELTAVLLIVAWLLFQAAYFATHIKLAIAPDEPHHVKLSLLYFYAQGFSIEEGPKTYGLGPLNTIPYLYHLLLGKLYHLNVFGLSPIEFYRYLNVLLGVGYLFAFWQLLKELSANRFIRILALLLAANIPMLTFLFGVTSYDNLINLLAVLTGLYVISFIGRWERAPFLKLMIVLLIGCLSKVTFLPLVLLTGLIFLFYAKSIFLFLFRFFRSPLSVREWILTIITLFFFALNVRLYGYNLWNHQAIFPSASQIFGEEIASKYYAQHRRDQEFIHTASSRPSMTIGEYMPKYFASASSSVFGIFGHKSFYQEAGYLQIYRRAIIPAAIGLIVFVLASFYLWPKESSTLRKYFLLTFLGLGYIAVVSLSSYRTFTLFRVFGSGLQGRYLFPALSYVLAIVSALSLYWLPRRIQPVVLLFVGWVVTQQGFLWLAPRLPDAMVCMPNDSCPF